MTFRAFGTTLKTPRIFRKRNICFINIINRTPDFEASVRFNYSVLQSEITYLYW